MKTRPDNTAPNARGAEATSTQSATPASTNGPSAPDMSSSSAAPSGAGTSGSSLPNAGHTNSVALGAPPSIQVIAAPPAPPPQPTQTSIPSAKIDPVRPPSLSLPKGGGAIQPLGDTFKTNPATGTGSFAIPIPAPSARGFGPSLALSYDSGSGNGVFGLGWNLSLGAVTRRMDRRLPQYNDAFESDSFVLSGAEDLVPVHPAPPENESDPERVTAYRPRTEGAFARIEKRKVKATGNLYWKVYSADGSVHFYGQTAASRIQDPQKTHRILSWLLDRVEDLHGNVMEVEYAAENLDGVSARDPAEQHRFRPHRLTEVTGNRYPKRVKYGNTTMGDISTAQFEIVFDYGEHDLTSPTPAPAPDKKWAVRQDPFSSYRGGFDLRTYRLCQRVLVFHHFSELGAGPTLVSSVDLNYNQSKSITLLSSATHKGYIRQSTPPNEPIVYSSQALPPLEFTYSLPTKKQKTLHFDPETLADIDVTTLGKRTQWVDLDGEGLSGLLTRDSHQFRYKRNLSGGKLAKAKTISTEPSIGVERARIVDLDGNGIPTFAQFDGPVPGSFARENGEFERFKRFVQLPNNVKWDSARVSLIDLNGDGRDDLLVALDGKYIWYPSLGSDGFDHPFIYHMADHDDVGPAVWPSTPFHMAVFFADMTGDGLPDLVRIIEGSLSYWPNLGNGRFGGQIVMQVPLMRFMKPRLDTKRIRLADMDGTGTADLIYFDDHDTYVFFNHSGNGFSKEPVILYGVSGQAASTAGVVDAFGRGTPQIVYSLNKWQNVNCHLRATDLIGDTKPYLLTAVKNNFGLETRIKYAPSTKFYLADKAAGTPWAHPLPFPVHVVEKVEVYDAVKKHRFVQEYTYHHGGYDPDEREFRGFGRVETLDTEYTAAHEGKGLFGDLPIFNNERPQPPVLTKTWFHLGILRHWALYNQAYQREWWRPTVDLGSPEAPPNLLGRPVVLAEQTSPVTLTQRHEAYRAMRGQTLRVEVYGLDGSENDTVPVQVAETRIRIVQKQGPRGGRGVTANHCVMWVHPEEAVTIHYEKNQDDPRIAHTLTLAVDEYGVTTKQATVVYGRKVPAPPPGQPPVESFPEQLSTHVVVGTRQVAHFPFGSGSTPTKHRLAVPLAEQSFELKMPTAPAAANGLYTPADVNTAFDGATPVPYENVATAGQKRLLGSAIHQYYNSANLPNALPEGTADVLALPYQSYALAFTPGLVTQAYGTKVDGPMLVAAGYQDRGAEGYWVKSGRQIFDSTHFYLPTHVIDPLGRTTSVVYDPYFLFAIQVTDPLGNTGSADIDYRTLTPWQTTDINGNRGQVAFDALGRVTKAAVMGKVNSSDGDTLTDPTMVYTYQIDRWYNTQPGNPGNPSGAALPKPSYIKTEHREKHGPTNTRWQTSYAFLDGAGGAALAKANAEPSSPGGPARWVATGRTIVNNKGNPIKQYEPYFSNDWDWEEEEALATVGVTALVTYDSMGRSLRVDLPDGTYARSIFSPWRVEQWDPNDTVNEAGNVWRLARETGATPTPAPEDIDAKNKALAHANTPSVVHLDSLGRAFLAIANNGASGNISTKTVFDIEGQVKSVVDGLGRTCATYDVSVDGQPLHETSIDSGEKWSLSNAMGVPLRGWDSLGHETRVEVDILDRLTHLWVKQGADAEALRLRVLYGESYPSPESQNLRGRACLVFDGAGVTETLPFDFKGNALSTSRRLAVAYATEPDWTTLASSGTPSSALAQAASLLENETFGKAFAFDALSRPTSVTMPDLSEIRPTYNDAGLLEAVDARIRNASVWTPFVTGISYDAKGRRERIDYGNTTFTEYTYDALSFRLTRLQTKRPESGGVHSQLQDLFYFYDPVGNITTIRDDAQQEVFFAGQQVTPKQEFLYDAIYRLIAATGREHAGGVGDNQRDNNDLPLWNLPHPNDAQALRRYEESYEYDAVGNILKMIHTAVGSSAGSWTRRYAYGANGVVPGGAGVPPSNRLHSTSLPGDAANGPYTAAYTHDLKGNMVAMPHLANVEYTHSDQMRVADLGGGGTAYYTYDAGGERVRKVIQRIGTTKEERIYLGGWELYRKRQGSNQEVVLERETLHLMDDTRRIAMVEAKTIDADVPGTLPIVSRTRYQYSNHLDSAHLECDESGLVISYEEYHPYGTPAYRSAKSGVEVSEKRFRYTGKERDDETGFQYHSARYYAPWLGRWTTADPAGMVDGPCLYGYCRGQPVSLNDPTGRETPSVCYAQPDSVLIKCVPVIDVTVTAPPRHKQQVSLAPKAVCDPNEDIYAEFETSTSEDIYAEAMGDGASDPGDFSDLTGAEQGAAKAAEEGIGSFFEGALAGDFADNASWSATAGQVAIGFIPVVGQMADIRDLIAAAKSVGEDKPGAWLSLGVAVAGFVPGLDFLKGAKKVGGKVLKEGADEAAQGIVKSGLKQAGKKLSKEAAERAARELKEIANSRGPLIDRLGAIATDPSITGPLRRRVNDAMNALRDHLKPADLSGALRDALGVPVRQKGAGKAFDHATEVGEALTSVSNLRDALVLRITHLKRVGDSDAIAEASRHLSAITDFLNKTHSFLSIR
ncbi:MAG: VCBS repeat-containing protein [Polyangiaceae bacterium]|nr:VCBS repeat-containing protein [Polyangiaceae bacterium]